MTKPVTTMEKVDLRGQILSGMKRTREMFLAEQQVSVIASSTVDEGAERVKVSLVLLSSFKVIYIIRFLIFAFCSGTFKSQQRIFIGKNFAKEGRRR